MFLTPSWCATGNAKIRDYMAPGPDSSPACLPDLRHRIPIALNLYAHNVRSIIGIRTMPRAVREQRRSHPVNVSRNACSSNALIRSSQSAGYCYFDVFAPCARAIHPSHREGSIVQMRCQWQLASRRSASGSRRCPDVDPPRGGTLMSRMDPPVSSQTLRLNELLRLFDFATIDKNFDTG